MRRNLVTTLSFGSGKSVRRRAACFSVMLRTISSRLRPAGRQFASARSYASGNEGRKGPLTGAEKKDHPNAGRKGPLTGRSRDAKTEAKDGSAKDAKVQSKNAEASESTKGAEASSDPTSAPGQGVENKGGHAMPEGPGESGAFAEQQHSTLDVAGTGQGVDSEVEQKVDAKFWSDKTKDGK